MATTDFNELFETLKQGVSSIAQETVKDYARQATKEGQKSLTGLKSDLKRWTEQVERGELSKEDLEFLLLGRKELTEMKVLQQLGIAKIQLDKFKNAITGLIVSTIIKI